MPEPDVQRVEDAARALLDDRITAVRTLAVARQHRHDKRNDLQDAERADAAAFAAALRAGWTRQELKQVGLDDPTRATSNPSRRARPTTPPAAPPAATTAAG